MFLHLLSSCGKEGALILSFIIMWNVSRLKNKQGESVKRLTEVWRNEKLVGKGGRQEVWRKEELLRKGGKADSDLLCSAIPGLHQLIEHVTLLRLIVIMLRFNMRRMVVMTMMVIVMMMKFNIIRMIAVMILMVPHIILKGRVCYLLVAARADCCQGRVEVLDTFSIFRF